MASTVAQQGRLNPLAESGRLRVLIGPHRLDPRLDVAVAPAMLAGTDTSSEAAWLRIYRPAATVAFGRLDTVAPQWEEAARAARSAGFTPVVRAPGGRAVAYHDDCICVDLIAPSTDARSGVRARFEQVGELFVEALRDIGIPAGIGPVPGEYCPGSHSVNAAGRVKLVGTAQRVTRHGSITSAVLVVRRAAPIRSITADVYGWLGLEFEPASVGAIEDMAPLVNTDEMISHLERRFTSRCGDTRRSERLDLLGLARAWTADHPDPCKALEGQYPRSVALDSVQKR